MIYFVELWNAKPEWTALSKEERFQYVEQVGIATQKLTDLGVEVITWSENKTTDPRKADYDFFAIWTVPSQEAAALFLEAVSNAGWYNYFDQVNIIGAKSEAPDILNTLAHL
ncbi:MAG: hypothetical protein KTR22_00095 [Flavobacteriaceae bacterium]|nr:hypothetical protein [Flavobacteriaceae bacterium]